LCGERSDGERDGWRRAEREIMSKRFGPVRNILGFEARPPPPRKFALPSLLLVAELPVVPAYPSALVPQSGISTHPPHPHNRPLPLLSLEHATVAPLPRGRSSPRVPNVEHDTRKMISRDMSPPSFQTLPFWDPLLGGSISDE